MENKQPLLSICIPTYNRAEYLEEAIYNIVTDDAFCDKVEIIISDNASTDNTKQVEKNLRIDIVMCIIIEILRILEIRILSWHYKELKENMCGCLMIL